MATDNKTSGSEPADAGSLKRVVSRRGHVLHTIFTCPCDKESDSPCCICDMGLAVCRICGAAECELDERDCIGEPANATELSGGRPDGAPPAKRKLKRE
ncbi:MAG: hypothetical protein KGL39_43800 [Patescibacteria group bacterium]|nr:hypothetical protein [Patescibacteria group bacterium]